MVKVFTSITIEDKGIKNLFIGQSKHTKVPYEFVDMSVKQPWDSSWKTNCGNKIKSCSGVIVLISKNLKQADGAIWEIKCAKEENIPILGVYMSDCSFSNAPDELFGIKKVNWNWEDVAEFINNL